MIQQPIVSYIAAPGLITGYRIPGRKYTAEVIIEKVCDYFCVPTHKMAQRTRVRNIVEARQICMYFIRRLTTLSFKQIAKLFGGRDHTTAMHSIGVVQDLMQSDREYRSRIEYLTSIL